MGGKVIEKLSQKSAPKYLIKPNDYYLAIPILAKVLEPWSLHLEKKEFHITMKFNCNLDDFQMIGKFHKVKILWSLSKSSG